VAVLRVDAVGRIFPGQRVGRTEDDGVAFDLGAGRSCEQQAGCRAGHGGARKSAGENSLPSPHGLIETGHVYLPLTGGCSAWFISAAFPSAVEENNKEVTVGCNPPRVPVRGGMVYFTDQSAV